MTTAERTPERTPELTPAPTPKPTRPAPGPRRPPARRGGAGRAATVAVLISGLIVSAIARHWAMALQVSANSNNPYAPAAEGAGSARQATTSFGSMNSFSLALLLGGLRGPLVMFLWISSESQKNEKDLEDFDTKIEWIRLLQPEFDTVLIYQIWNKAYNISAQRASLVDKYGDIVDAVRYAKDGDASRPNNVNILLAIEGIYSQKLGTTTGDKVYYIKRVREETKAHEPRQESPGAVRRHLDPVLDPQGKILPELLAAKTPRPADLKAQVIVPAARMTEFATAAAQLGVVLPDAPPPSAATPQGADRVIVLDEAAARKLDQKGVQGVLFIYADWNDGSELQYLKKYEPYPDGVSPLALGFNYAKRAQVLMTVGKQKPSQLGQGIVDVKPGLELRDWANDEWTRAVDAENHAFEKSTASPGAKAAEANVVSVGSKVIDRTAFANARREFDLAARISRDARAEYERHVRNPAFFINRMQDYGGQIDTLLAQEYLLQADTDFLIYADPSTSEADRRAAAKRAIDSYLQAALTYEYVELRYYAPDEVITPMLKPFGYTRRTVGRFLAEHPNEFSRFFGEAMTWLRANQARLDDASSDDRREFDGYLRRASTRRRDLINAISAGSPGPAAGRFRPADLPFNPADKPIDRAIAASAARADGPSSPAGPSLPPTTEPAAVPMAPAVPLAPTPVPATTEPSAPTASTPPAESPTTAAAPPTQPAGPTTAPAEPVR